MDFETATARIRAELAARPPFLLKLFDRFEDWMRGRPLRLVELHASNLLATAAERRRVEPRLPLRRQAIVLVMGALLIDMDLCSLRSGVRRGDGEFGGRGQEWIAELTGMKLRRIRRALEDLRLAGYLSQSQPIEPYLPEGACNRSELRYCAHFAIYRFELKWFERIKYDGRLKRERASASKRRAERTRIYGASLVKARRALRRLRNSNSPTRARSGRALMPRPPDTSR